MKTRIILSPLLFASIFATAQYTPNTPLNSPREEQEEPEENGKGFDPARAFVGGSIGLGLGFGSYNSSWSIGGFPQIGYSFSDWFDAGLIFNANYSSQKYTNIGNYEEKYTSFNYGTGVFLRAFPFQSFFVQAQPEINWIKYKQKVTGFPTTQTTVNAPSLLVGVGYGQRMIGQSGFFTTLMLDVLNEPNSPYRDYGGGVIPILRGGFYVYLGGKKRNNYND